MIYKGGIIIYLISIDTNNKFSLVSIYVNGFLLSFLSYAGGISAYFLGKLSLRIDAVKQYLEVKMEKHLKNTSKWGGFLIVVGALLPLPFAISCMTAGMIKYPLKNVLIFGLFRFLRFAIYAWAIFNLVS